MTPKIGQTMTSKAIGLLRSACAACVLCLALVACGSSGTAATTSGSSGSTQKLRFVDCMRSHGVPNLPDPGATPSGSSSSFEGIVIPSSIDMQSPAFKSAEQACEKLLPGGSASGPPGSAGVKHQLLALAKCMRSHGVPNFPDPTSSPPPPGSGNVMGGNGVYLTVPPAGQQSPAFKHAAAVCGAS